MIVVVTAIIKFNFVRFVPMSAVLTVFFTITPGRRKPKALPSCNKT